jgi:hypothetical protein
MKNPFLFLLYRILCYICGFKEFSLRGMEDFFLFSSGGKWRLHIADFINRRIIPCLSTPFPAGESN